MKEEKLEQWITKREIQKHSQRKRKKYKSPKTSGVSLADSLDKIIKSAEDLLNYLNKLK